MLQWGLEAKQGVQVPIAMVRSHQQLNQDLAECADKDDKEACEKQARLEDAERWRALLRRGLDSAVELLLAPVVTYTLCTDLLA